MDLIYIAPDQLKPHEQISDRRLEQVLAEIRENNLTIQPILVDRVTNVILDGHHRHGAAKILGLTAIPCVCVDYLEDVRISVEPRRGHIPITKQLVIQMGISDDVYPQKTTKHTIAIQCEYMERPLKAGAASILLLDYAEE